MGFAQVSVLIERGCELVRLVRGESIRVIVFITTERLLWRSTLWLACRILARLAIRLYFVRLSCCMLLLWLLLLLMQVLLRAPWLHCSLCIVITGNYSTGLWSTAICTAEAGLALWTDTVQIVPRISFLTNVCWVTSLNFHQWILLHQGLWKQAESMATLMRATARTVSAYNRAHSGDFLSHVENLSL